MEDPSSLQASTSICDTYATDTHIESNKTLAFGMKNICQKYTWHIMVCDYPIYGRDIPSVCHIYTNDTILYIFQMAAAAD
jgi:hypothetical protein